jgi:hypothetical protein
MISDLAFLNKSVVDRYAALARRQRLRIWFKIFKKNTVETEESRGAVQQVGKTLKLKREAVIDGYEEVQPDDDNTNDNDDTDDRIHIDICLHTCCINL